MDKVRLLELSHMEKIEGWYISGGKQDEKKIYINRGMYNVYCIKCII